MSADLILKPFERKSTQLFKSLFVLIFAAIGLILVACGTQLDSDEPAPAATDNSLSAVVAPRTEPSTPSDTRNTGSVTASNAPKVEALSDTKPPSQSENPATSSVTASIASSADSPSNLNAASPSSDSPVSESAISSAQAEVKEADSQETQSQLGLAATGIVISTDVYERESVIPPFQTAAISAQGTSADSDMVTRAAPPEARLVGDSIATASSANGTSESIVLLAVPRPVVQQGNEVSDAAFGFTLPNALGPDQTLESFRGDKNVVVVFYRAFW